MESCQEDVAVVVAGHGRNVAAIALKHNFTTSVTTFVMVSQQVMFSGIFQTTQKAMVHLDHGWKLENSYFVQEKVKGESLCVVMLLNITLSFQEFRGSLQVSIDWSIAAHYSRGTSKVRRLQIM